MEFRRIPGLPPYVFTIIDGLKQEARRAGRDVVDLGFGNPDLPSPDDRGGEARRGGPQQPQPPLLGQPGHPQAAPGGRRALPAQVRRHARPRHRGALDDRRQGGLQPPDVGAPAAGRRRAGALAVLPDPHLGPLLRRGRCPAGARRRRRGLRRERDGGLGPRLAEAAGRRAVVPAQPDDRDRRAGRPAAAGRLGARARRRAGARLRLCRRRVRRLHAAVDPAVRGRRWTAPSSSTR